MKKIFIIVFGLLFQVCLNGQVKHEILPIELLYFEGIALNNGILLRWGTATEVNNYGFEIQRGDGNLYFNSIDFVPGSGNSNSPKHYLYVDSTITSTGNYFYRLKQIDTDGTYSFSDTIQVFYQQLNIDEENNFSFKFSVRNDYKSKIILIDGQKDNFWDEMNLEIYDILGKKVFSRITHSTPIIFNYSNLPSGIYLIRLTQNQQTLFLSKFNLSK